MIRKNYYKRITESIIQAHRDTTLDSAMDDDGSENMGKKIVAIITADPDQDLDWESEYEPFGATELTADDEQEAMEHEGMESEHDTCPSCGYDVDCEGDDCEDDDDDMEDLMIGGGFEDEAEDDYEDMDVKDILVDILQELKGEDSEDESDDTFETSAENPMFGNSDDSEEDDDEEDYDSMLSSNDSDWGNEYSDSDSDSEDDEQEDDYDEEEDFEDPTEVDDSIFNAPQEQEEDEVYTFDALDNA